MINQNNTSTLELYKKDLGYLLEQGWAKIIIWFTKAFI